MPQSAGPLRRVWAVVDCAAVCSQPHVEQLAARVVMAAVIERRRSPKPLADQMPMKVILNVGRVSVLRIVAEIVGGNCLAYALRS